MKIAFIYTGAVIIPEITALAKETLPNYSIMNILDDALIADCQKSNGMTVDIQRRLCNLYQYAYEAGADIIVNTCSSVGGSVDIGKALLPIPLYRIDRPMGEKAAAEGTSIGVIATLPTTLHPTCQLIEQCAAEQHKEVCVHSGLAKGAYEANCAGDGALHDALILKTAKELADKCDVIVLAQASMQRMEHQLNAETGIPVYSSPKLFFDCLKEKLLESHPLV